MPRPPAGNTCVNDAPPWTLGRTRAWFARRTSASASQVANPGRAGPQTFSEVTSEGARPVDCDRALAIARWVAGCERTLACAGEASAHTANSGTKDVIARRSLGPHASPVERPMPSYRPPRARGRAFRPKVDACRASQAAEEATRRPRIARGSPADQRRTSRYQWRGT